MKLHWIFVAGCILIPCLLVGCGKDSPPSVTATAGSVESSDPIGTTSDAIAGSPASSDPESPIADVSGEPFEDTEAVASDSEPPPEPEDAGSDPGTVASEDGGPSPDAPGDTSMVSADVPDALMPDNQGADGMSESIVTLPNLRLLLPTSAGLILVDADVRVGETSLKEAFADQVEQILGELGEPEDVTWEALLEKINANPTRFGRSMFQTEQTDNVVRLFDTNRNGKPDPPEATKILFRRSQTDQPFRVDGTDSFRDINRLQSRLWETLDQNSDRKIDSAEIGVCREMILRLDQNGDGRVGFDEVVDTPPNNDPAWNRRRSTRWGDVAMDLTGYIDWRMLAYNLDQAAKHGAFGTDANLLDRIDADHDEQVSVEEAKSLLTCEPDLRIRVDFAESGSQSPEVSVLGTSTTLRSKVRMQPSAGQVWISNETFGLLIRVQDLLGRADLIPVEAFNMLDANNDGGLDEDEIPAPALQEYSFEQLDLDGDEKLTLSEIRRGMAQQASVWNVQVRGRAAESRDAVFDWLDENHDRMLSARELRDLAQHLSERTSEDGYLYADRIPDAFHVILGRGDPDRNDQLFQLSSTRNPASAMGTRPRWAQAMDSNGDGDIDPSEFIGTREQFQTLDQDADGFINSIEAGGSMGGSDHPERPGQPEQPSQPERGEPDPSSSNPDPVIESDEPAPQAESTDSEVSDATSVDSVP